MRSFTADRWKLSGEVCLGISGATAFVVSMEHEHRQHTLVMTCEGHRHPKPTPNHRRHQQRHPFMGVQVSNHDPSNNHVAGSERLRGHPAGPDSNSSGGEARMGGMTMNEWWSDDKIEISRHGLLRSSSGERRMRAEEVGKRNQSLETGFSAKIELSLKCLPEPFLREHCVGAKNERKGNLPAARPSLEAGLAGCETMNDWWSTLSARVGTTRSRLHTEILSFCKTRELTPEQAQSRRLAQSFLERAVLEIWPNAKVHLYGSSATGLALPTSDIDIVVVMEPTAQNQNGWSYSGRPSPDTGPWVSELYGKLDRMPNMFQCLTQIPHAKVPILKAVFRTGLACDISFDWHDNKQEKSVQIVKQFLQQYEAFKPLCMVLKSFLKHHKLNEVFTGGIGSFCLIIMIVNLLQNLGSSEGAVAAYNDLGLLLVSFFMYYSQMHNYVTDVVSITPGRHVSKQVRGWVNWSDPERLSVENPLDSTSDIGSASYNIHDVRLKFSQARRVLLSHWDDENLLYWIFKTSVT